jgi:hypothetical protein
MTTGEVTSSSGSADESLGFETWPILARVETDRFCDHCGYNLHTQSIRCEPRTRVLTIRCPECGRFHPANDVTARMTVWARRLAGAALILWALIVISLALTLGGFQIAATYLILDELTTHMQVQYPSAPRSLGGPMSYVHELELNPGYYYQPSNDRRRHEIYAITGSMSLGLGIVGTLIAIVVVPHWRWQHHLTFIAIWATAAAGITALIWWTETARLFHWGLRHIAAQSAVYVLGGLMAMIFGRPVIRLAARICLTPRMRKVIEGAWARVESTPQDQHAKQ